MSFVIFGRSRVGHEPKPPKPPKSPKRCHVHHGQCEPANAPQPGKGLNLPVPPPRPRYRAIDECGPLLFDPRSW